jgi:hypothetical protein
MPAPRLNDSQKEELVARYRQGETAQALAAAYGCSPNTVSRVLKAVLDPQEMEAIKRQSRGKAAASVAEGEAAAPAVEASPETPEVVEAPLTPAAAEQALPDDDDDQHKLAIDDADDFGDDGLEDADSGTDDGSDDADDAATEAVVADPAIVLEAQPLIPGALPASVYLLVDKTVELQPRPLAEFTELGSLPEEEQERQALMLYTNPRQAKRQCGRTQRVIKVPDAGVLERRSSYLVAQGITRLVLEGGSLFALANN